MKQGKTLEGTIEGIGVWKFTPFYLDGDFRKFFIKISLPDIPEYVSIFPSTHKDFKDNIFYNAVIEDPFEVKYRLLRKNDIKEKFGIDFISFLEKIEP